MANVKRQTRGPRTTAADTFPSTIRHGISRRTKINLEDRKNEGRIIDWQNAYGLNNVSKVKPKTIAMRLDQIVVEQGRVTRQMVYDEGMTDRKSPFYPLLEHDQAKAAKKWNLQQANAIIGGIFALVWNENENRLTPVRVYQSITIHTDEGYDLEYQPLRKVVIDVASRDDMLKKALIELSAWQQKHENHSFLRPYTKGVGAVIKAMKIKVYSKKDKQQRPKPKKR
jgi:hypothetical protein